MPKMDKISTAAVIENIPIITEHVDSFMEANDIPMKVAMQMDIAIDEILSNIAKFAYDDIEGEMTVEAFIDNDLGKIELTFIDLGTPFNPLELAEPDVHQSLEDRPIGGLGIFMVKKSMDEIHYEYRDGSNVLTISKKFA